jgi:hypothetical protein
MKTIHLLLFSLLGLFTACTGRAQFEIEQESEAVGAAESRSGSVDCGTLTGCFGGSCIFQDVTFSVSNVTAPNGFALSVKKVNNPGFSTCGTINGDTGDTGSCVFTLDYNIGPIPKGQTGFRYLVECVFYNAPSNGTLTLTVTGPGINTTRTLTTSGGSFYLIPIAGGCQ